MATTSKRFYYSVFNVSLYVVGLPAFVVKALCLSIAMLISRQDLRDVWQVHKLACLHISQQHACRRG